ncbi:CKLF-like MARVEL transmembrane domain-containing 8 [Labeo rohita]|uniref:CKLF-like MARVEL transmembrane domain-containing 8 n=1 Tax=Labeo rohita TaxID=84645 RepID=A0A498LCK4_LABRO|nr:CKLF-like MARVEL transmembrane domain-containing 8 [Labeo rohita]
MDIDSESRTDSSITDRTSKSSNIESLGLTHSGLAYDGNFMRSASGVFMTGEIIFASLAMVCYVGNTVVNFKSWRSKSEDT